MFRRLKQRRNSRTSHVLCVFVESNDSRYSDHCVIGPMSEDVANEMATFIVNSTSSAFGERLNGIKFHVDVVPRKMLREDDGAEWLVNTICDTFERERPSQLRRLSQALSQDSDFIESIHARFPWLARGDEDGVVFDTTGWGRPDLAKWMRKQYGLDSQEKNEDGDD